MEFAPREGPGRPQLYCRRSHRQRYYEARRLAERHGLAAADVIVDKAKLGELADRVYVLETACEDARRDLTGSPTKDDYRQAVVHLLQAALPVANLRIETRPVGRDT